MTFNVPLVIVLVAGCYLVGCQAKDSAGGGEKQPALLLLVLEGHSTPGAALIRPNGTECASVPVVPPPPAPYGSPGRVGSSAGYNRRGGQVVLCGGLDSSGPPISSYKDCQVLDLKERKWIEPSPAPSMPELLAYSGYTTTSDGHLVVAGGVRTSNKSPGATTWLESNRIYSLNLNNYKSGWKELKTRLPNNASHSHLCAAATANGSAVFILGDDFSGKLDVAQDSWSELPALRSADAGCIAETDEFGSIHLYAAGGSALGGRQIARMELGKEETWRSGRWEVGGGLETKEGRPNRPAVARFPSSVVIAAGSEFATSNEVLSEHGWTAWGGGLRLRTTRRDSADVVVEMKHFPECK